MATGHLLTEDLNIPNTFGPSSRPMDSSRILFELMQLSHQADEARRQNGQADMLEDVISKSILRRLLSALHFRDAATVNHSRRVAKLSVGIAQFLSWEGQPLKLLEVAGLLHDIGKIGVPDNILFKPGRLNPDEAGLMALHYNISLDVLQACRVDRGVLEIISQSHTHYNGATDGFRRIGSDVHQGARILAVADAYDSLSMDKVYREKKTHEEIMEILHAESGTQFDGNIVRALSRWIDTNGLPFQTEKSEPVANQAQMTPVDHEETLRASSLGNVFSYLYILESLYDGFYLVDADRHYRIWNRGAERLLGQRATTVLNQTWDENQFEMISKFGDPLPEEERPLRRIFETGKATTSEIQIQQTNGSWIPVELQSVPVVDDNGLVIGVAEIFRDLSRTGTCSEYRELKLAACRDSLTSVANRGSLETQLAMLITEFSESSLPEPFSAIFLDIDHFKQINDTFGHSIGDQVLIEIARLLQHETYSGELVGRFGGEEFMILCPATNLDQAQRRAERLRLAICAADIAELDDFSVSASFGVAQSEPGDSVESIIRRADTALYASKEGGRNRTTTLTTAEMIEQNSTAKEQKRSADAMRFQTVLHACVASDIVIYKLGGFVDDHRASLREVTSERVVIRIGSRGILPFWGGSDRTRPVEMELEFGDRITKTRRRSKEASSRVEIQVRIRPIGIARNREAFQARAKRVLHALREYLVAD